MHNLIDYLSKLDFAYLKTYSGLRGPIFDELNAGFRELPVEEREQRKLKMATYLEQEELYNIKIVEANGTLHKSTTEIIRTNRHSEICDRIVEILTIEYKSQSFAMCPPVFRDALVFYGLKNEIVGILHLCFGCAFIQDEAGNDMQVDDRIFPMLQKELTRLGHPINTETKYF